MASTLPEGGQVSVTASSGGRKITMDPLNEYDVTFTLRQVESLIPAGFRQVWVTGQTTDGQEPHHDFELHAGAGLGSPRLINSMISAIDNAS